MGWQDDARCRIVTTIVQETQQMLEQLLDSSRIEQNCDCIVKKHPDACIVCRANNDCARVPVHAKCRCVKEFSCF